MTINAARELRDGQVCLVGVGPPNAAANLARRLQAPGCVLVYESGAIGAKPVRLPLSIGDDDLAETALELVSVPEMFNYWIGGGRIDVGFLGAAQIDPHANINTTVIGPYDEPKVRLPGAGGAPEIAALREVDHRDRAPLPARSSSKLDFVTSLAHRARPHGGHHRPRCAAPSRRRRAGAGRAPPWGRGRRGAQEATGWDLRVADPLEHTPPVTQRELEALRELAGLCRELVV